MSLISSRPESTLRQNSPALAAPGSSAPIPTTAIPSGSTARLMVGYCPRLEGDASCAPAFAALAPLLVNARPQLCRNLQCVFHPRGHRDARVDTLARKQHFAKCFKGTPDRLVGLPAGKFCPDLVVDLLLFAKGNSQK